MKFISLAAESLLVNSMYGCGAKTSLNTLVIPADGKQKGGKTRYERKLSLANQEENSSENTC